MTKDITDLFYMQSGYVTEAFGSPVGGSKNEVPLEDVTGIYLPAAVTVFNDWAAEDLELDYDTLTTEDRFLDVVLALIAIYIASLTVGLTPYGARDGKDTRNYYLVRAEELLLGSKYALSDRDGKRVMKGHLQHLVASHVLGKAIGAGGVRRGA